MEWEFALVDAQTRDLSNEATAVIAEIGENPRVHKELLRNTVEIVSGICDCTAQAMDDLRDTLHTARRIVRDRGMELFCAGTHPFARWSAQKLTDAPRYAELIKRTQWWGRQMLIWGVHVHVGISSAHKVMPIMTALLQRYPHLLALSASSPWWGGEDTGYASNRAMMFQQLPTAGLPFHFQTWAEFEGFVYDQKKTGIIDHMDEIRWDIRPRPTKELLRCASATGLQPARVGCAGGADALPGGRLGPSSGSRRDTAEHAAVACPGKQVARCTLRPGRRDHLGCRQQRTPGHRRSDRCAQSSGAGGEVVALRRRASFRRRHSPVRGVVSAAASGGRGA
ncbi:carboxylate-amine ligase, YbdK family protein [Mycobacterium xenopi 3993]|nr:carboxylate-amine ligase, YbdK family protein [Mycobacterium xenopi 3993]